MTRRRECHHNDSVRYTRQMADQLPDRSPRSLTDRRPGAPALRRGLAVLQVLACRPSPMSATTVARELELARSTVYELLTELAAAGFVVHLPAEHRWGLGVSAFEIGSAYLRGEPLERLGRPVVHRLAVAAAELDPAAGGTAHLGVLHGNQMLYLVKDRAGRFGPTLVTEVGVRLPAALTATGVSLLAGLPDRQLRALFPDKAAFVRRTAAGPTTLSRLRVELAGTAARGWAVEHGWVSAGTASVAAAAVDHQGRPLAAIGVTVRHDCDDPACVESFPRFAELVRQGAAALTAAVGGRQPS